MYDGPEEEFLGESTLCMWSHIVDALLRRLLTEDVLQAVQKKRDERPTEGRRGIECVLPTRIEREQINFGKQTR